MRQLVFASAVLALLSLTSVMGSAAPTTGIPTTAARPSITLVQGWWEQENQEQPARERYWQLRRTQADQYNRLQYEINQLQRQRAAIDARINRDIEVQHRLLGFQP